MIINKITVGFVIQSYDTETKEWIGQDFIASDEVIYETEEGEPTDERIEDYLPFDMVQPESSSTT